jgi:G3E family GTPase
MVSSNCLTAAFAAPFAVSWWIRFPDLMDRMQTGRIRPFSRVVIETTGLADPVPVMQSVIGHPTLGQSYRLEGLVTVVDAVNGLVHA